MTVRPERAPSLGRGLSALIPQRTAGQPGPVEIPVDRIRPNPHQPRKRFDEAEMATLVASIREHGILQPILVVEVASQESPVCQYCELSRGRVEFIQRHRPTG